MRLKGITSARESSRTSTLIEGSTCTTTTPDWRRAPRTTNAGGSTLPPPAPSALAISTAGNWPRSVIGSEPLQAERVYTVTTFDFLASGDDLYSGFVGAKVAAEDGPEFADLLIQHFASEDLVAVPVRGRLVPVQ